MLYSYHSGVAVKELNSSYYVGEVLYYSLNIHIYIYIYTHP